MIHVLNRENDAKYKQIAFCKTNLNFTILTDLIYQKSNLDNIYLRWR